VVAREVGVPEDVKPVEWRLLTNRAAPTLAQAIELIDWYRARWEIEVYFNVLKNGCEVEELQLSAIERVERALALFMVVAWRFALPHAQRPELPRTRRAVVFRSQ
jgi:IS4 transposase